MSQQSDPFSSIAWQAAAPTGHFAAGLAAYNNARYGTAIRVWKPLADLGHVDAQYNLGVMYGNGLGVLQDHQEAARLFRLAADQGDASAQFNLAVRYDNGLGVLRDSEAAASLFRLAADQGHAGAQSKINDHATIDF